MDMEKIFQEIKDNIEEVIAHEAPIGSALWDALLLEHPADIAEFLGKIDREHAQQLFANLPKKIKFAVFEELSDSMKVHLLSFMSEQEAIDALHVLAPEDLADLFDLFSDEDLKKYLSLLHKKEREKVLSLLKFDPESAGGIMATDVFTLMEDFTVDQSIKLLQRLSPSRDIHQQIFVTDRAHHLVGHINLQDLVLQKPKDRIGSFMRKNELVVRTDEDQEAIAKEMIHYGLMTVPVVSDDNIFLGVIPSETLVDVIIEEASEDVQKMASLPPLKYPYFEMSFWRLFYQRSYVLIALLIAESFSGTILRAYEAVITGMLVSFIPMLTSAGGNTGSQTSAVVIQGMASGEITYSNMFRLLRREFLVASMSALLLGCIAFIRVYFVGGTFFESLAVSCALGSIVLISALLGTVLPFILRRFNIDPAFSAGPFLATVMDILGIVLYCYISKLLLS